MSKTRIVPGISTFNFDYRVVRIIERDKDGNVRVIDGKLDYYYAIYEIWFGGDGEIVAYCAKPEIPMGDSLDDLKYELKEYRNAVKKPILDFEFVKDQTRRSSRRIRRRYKKGVKPESNLEKTVHSAQDVIEGKAESIPVENVFRDFGIAEPDIRYIPYKEACERFRLLEDKEIDGNDTWFNQGESDPS